MVSGGPIRSDAKSLLFMGGGIQKKYTTAFKRRNGNNYNNGNIKLLLALSLSNVYEVPVALLSRTTNLLPTSEENSSFHYRCRRKW